MQQFVLINRRQLIYVLLFLSNSKKRKLSQTGDVEGNRGNKSRNRNKHKKPAELSNFYRFQMRQDKQNKLEDLRIKFEKDRQKVAMLKTNRKFKPF